MLRLGENTLLYHGSYTEIASIDLSLCKGGLDFGRGFYVTSSYKQARDYIPPSVRKNIRRHQLPVDYDVNMGRISVYRFHEEPTLRIHYFHTADRDWLHYVAGNRDNSLFRERMDQLSTCDIVCGKIANDSTAAVLNAYIAGEYGEPGSARADEFAISNLLPDRLQDQFCFRTPAAIRALEFVCSKRYDDNEYRPPVLRESDADFPLLAQPDGTIPDKRRNACTVALMRRMLIKYAQQYGIPFDEALLQFTASPAYEALFDYDTAIWREGPDYLMQMFEEFLQTDRE